MAAIIKQFDKRSGITYAYESISYWDKEKKQSRSKRTLIGRVDEETGEIIPTKGLRKKTEGNEFENAPRRGAVPSTDFSRKFYGATYLLDSISEKIGLTHDLKICFPNTYKQILSLAYYLVLEPDSPMYRFEKWGILHKHPYGKNISSERSTEILAGITEDAKQRFFQLQGKRRAGKEYLAYDTTSISSYSELLNQVQYGKNKEHDKLPQLNLALVFGEESNLPFYYRKLAGNIPDSITVTNLLADLREIGISKVKLVLDRGFYSESNINGLYKEHIKFLIAAKSSTKFIRKEIDKVCHDISHLDNYIGNYGIYGKTLKTEWEYTHVQPRKGQTIKTSRRMYVHIFYDKKKAVEDEIKLDNYLFQLRQELETESRVCEHESHYTKYFTIKKTPKRGTRAKLREDVVKTEKRYSGYFVLISNDANDEKTALDLYRNKDVVEKAFENLKERLEMRRMRVFTEKTLDGKLFIQFIGLIFLSYLKKQMSDQNLFQKYSLSEVLDKLDVIECFECPGKKMRVGEVLKNQKELFTKFGVESL